MVIAGTFHGTVDFGCGPLTSQAWPDQRLGTDVFAAKFDAFGRCVWSRIIMHGQREFEIPIPGTIRSLAVDPNGDLVTCGWFNGTLDLVDTTLVNPMGDVFVAKLSPEGVLWAKRFGITAPLGNRAEGVTVDANGNIVVIGSFSGRVNFGGGVLQPFGAFDVFLAKLDPNGAHLWSYRYGSQAVDEGRAVMIDDQGHIRIAGSFANTIDFGGGALADGTYFVAELDAQAMHLSSSRIQVLQGGFGWYPTGFSISPTGHLRMAAYIPEGGLVTIDGLMLNGPISLMVSFDPLGSYEWHLPVPNAYGMTVNENAAGGVDMATNFTGTIQLGDQTLVSGGDYDALVARFDANGELVWVKSFGGAGHDTAQEVLDGVDSEIWTTGIFEDGIDFGAERLAGQGMYIAKLGRRPVIAVSVFPRPGAIEIRWSASDDAALDTFQLLRYHAAETEATVVASGPVDATQGTFVDGDVRPGEKYQYEFVVVTEQGDEFRSSLVSATVPVFSTTLAQNAPNPFNPRTTIEYSLDHRADVTLEIYDATGALVRRIVEGVRDAGEYAIEWDGRNDAGNVVGTGVYFYRLDGIAGVAPRKMVLLK